MDICIVLKDNMNVALLKFFTGCLQTLTNGMYLVEEFI